MKDKEFELLAEEHLRWKELENSGLDKPFTGIEVAEGEILEEEVNLNLLIQNGHPFSDVLKYYIKKEE